MFRGNHARNTGKILRDADIPPIGTVKKRFNREETVVAEFEDQQAARFQMLRSLRNQRAVKFVAFFTTKEGSARFVFAHFDGKRVRVAQADVGRIADDEIEEA